MEAWETVLERAYGQYLWQHCRVDFVRGGGLPYVQTAPDGSPYVELESLDWHTREKVSLKEPSMLQMAAGGPRIGRAMIAERIERAVALLQEPPPLWVDP
jgi:hypothetical protein